MLETLLKIGETFRNVEGPGGLKHHRYVKQAPQATEKQPISYYSIPVQADFTFDLNNRVPLTDDDFTKNRLFYLNYKTSDADSMKKYIFGDICHQTITNKKTGEISVTETNFVLGDPSVAAKGFQVNSFVRGQQDASAFVDTLIEKFRNSLKTNIEALEALLHDKPSIFLHFDFEGKSWYEFESEMNLINQKLLDEFVEHSEIANGYVLKKALYKTLASGRNNVPGFDSKSQYKNRIFRSFDDVLNLLYAIDYSQRAVIRERDIKIIVLPRGNEQASTSRLTAKQIETFFERKSLSRAEQSEENLAAPPPEISGDETNLDKLFAAVMDDVDDNIVQFDFIFSKAGSGPSTPDSDLLEISGLEKSRLTDLSKKVRHIRNKLNQERQLLFKKELAPLDITRSFLNILGDMTRAKKKYQNHLFKVLPQIYSETYYDDPVLLPALIEKIQFNIRSGGTGFNLFKYDFYFLILLQNYEGDRLMDIQGSQSYQVGSLLGKMGRQFAGPKSPIKSFEKNYVGLLSRRISTLPDVVKLHNEINQKLVMHDRTKFTFRTSSELAEKILNFDESIEKYDSNFCAFGFFESYFQPYQRADDGSKAPELTAAEGQDED